VWSSFAVQRILVCLALLYTRPPHAWRNAPNRPWRDYSTHYGDTTIILGMCAAVCGDGLQALGMRGMSSGAVVEWNTDGSCTRPGSEASHYEAARAECGAHLLFNAFWSVSHCCIHALLMCGEMHQIDLGVIIRLIMAILR
jgi:hypothetical protein